jgi:hypothetical protein
MRVTSVDAHNWQSDAAEFVPKPDGHRFPPVGAVWRRLMNGDSALVWLDDRVH